MFSRSLFEEIRWKVAHRSYEYSNSCCRLLGLSLRFLRVCIREPRVIDWVAYSRSLVAAVCCDIYGLIWISMDIYGYLWKSMDIDGYNLLT
jgi:hypothetical protein